MKLIKPSFEIIEQKPGLEGIYEQIELAGRTCYKSTRPEGKTAKDFVDRMINSGHGSILEHGTVYLTITQFTNQYHREHFTEYYRSKGITESDIGDQWIKNYLWKYDSNKYSKVVNKSQDGIDIYYITTNLRVLVENGWLDDFKHICEPTKFHEKRVTVRLKCGVDISREFNRHRSFSVAEQSTRYCNYTKNKFNGITYMIPDEFKNILEEGYYTEDPNDTVFYYKPLEDIDADSLVIEYHDLIKENPGIYNFLSLLDRSELVYTNLINVNGWTPQIARKVLPLDLGTEVVYTAFVSDWQHFFGLRAKGTTGAPHPDAKALAEPLYKEFINRGYI